MKPPKTIALDFDGVMHSYVSGWTGPTPSDPPVIGTREAVNYMRHVLGHKVVIFSCRALTADGFNGIQDWLSQNNIVVDEVTGYKPHAVLYVDDRGYRFDGDWRAVLDAAREVPRPWNWDSEAGPKGSGAPFAPKCATCGVLVGHVTQAGFYDTCAHPVPNQHKERAA